MNGFSVNGFIADVYKAVEEAGADVNSVQLHLKYNKAKTSLVMGPAKVGFTPRRSPFVGARPSSQILSFKNLGELTEKLAHAQQEADAPVTSAP